jgi:hypothetical protein
MKHYLLGIFCSVFAFSLNAGQVMTSTIPNPETALGALVRKADRASIRYDFAGDDFSRVTEVDWLGRFAEELEAATYSLKPPVAAIALPEIGFYQGEELLLKLMILPEGYIRCTIKGGSEDFYIGAEICGSLYELMMSQKNARKIRL